MAKAKLSVNGQVVEEVQVVLCSGKRRIRFRRWAVINLERTLKLDELSGTEARLLIALMISPDKSLSTRELSKIVGAPTATVCRSARRLEQLGVVEHPQRGYWHINQDFVHYGRWNVQSILSPQSQQ